jgi:DNA topoisomerase-1
MDTKFTSHMEEELDEIEEGKQNSEGVLREFYDLFSESLSRARKEMTAEKGLPDPEGRTCPNCGQPMLRRWSRHGRYLACTDYPRCSTTMPLDENGQVIAPVQTDQKCEKCGSPMVLRSGRRGRFLACSAYPKCSFTMSVDANNQPLRPTSTDQVCDKCGKPMVVRSGRRGPFLACSGYPKCRNPKPLPTGVACPQEGCKGQLVRRYARGRGSFFGCSNYPKCRYTTHELPGTERPAPPEPPETPPPHSAEDSNL